MARPARANHLVLNVAELLRRPGSEKDIKVTTSTEELGIVDDRLADGPVVIALHLHTLTDGIVVTGTIGATWQGACRRCLAPLGGPLVLDVQELYQTKLTDPDAFPLVQEQLDLAPLAREALLLDAPGAPLCKADCLGICPTCGADRNTSQCSCDTGARDVRWSALDALRRESR